MLSTRDPPQNKGHIQTESEGLEKIESEKIFHTNGDQKKAEVAILISDKIDFKIKAVKKDKEGHHITIKGSIQEEDSVQFSHSIMSNSLRPHGVQHARLPCPSPTPRVNSKFMSIESVMPSNHLILCFPFLLLPSIFPSIRVFSPVSQLFASGGQSIGVSASTSVLPMNIQD